MSSFPAMAPGADGPKPEDATNRYAILDGLLLGLDALREDLHVVACLGQ